MLLLLLCCCTPQERAARGRQEPRQRAPVKPQQSPDRAPTLTFWRSQSICSMSDLATVHLPMPDDAAADDTSVAGGTTLPIGAVPPPNAGENWERNRRYALFFLDTRPSDMLPVPFCSLPHSFAMTPLSEYLIWFYFTRTPFAGSARRRLPRLPRTWRTPQR